MSPAPGSSAHFGRLAERYDAVRPVDENWWEVYELVERVTWLRVVAFAFNVFAVIYILWTKRLFGFRGGRAAFDAERHSQSLLEVEQAATPAG